MEMVDDQWVNISSKVEAASPAPMGTSDAVLNKEGRLAKVELTEGAKNMV